MRSERRALDKLYKRRDRYEIPDWQREEVWSDEKKRELIDTILRGWKLPKFYFQKTNTDPDEYDVVDGQQRLTAIWEFFDGELSLPAESAGEFGGNTYQSLSEEISDRFDDYEIEYDEITDATDEDVKEFFKRLQAGLPLTGSEKLNSVHSKLRDYCKKTAKDSFFSETTVIANKRHAYFDIAAKVVTIEIEGLDAGLRYEDVRKVFIDHAAFSPQSAAARRINAALSFLRENFPEPFKQFRNRTIVQSIITFVCHLQSSGMKKSQGAMLKLYIEHFLSELTRQVELGQTATDSDFLDFQRTVNANVKSGARERQLILLRKLFQQHPVFFSSLSQSEGIAAGVEQSVAKMSKSIRHLVGVCNDRYASKLGKDLFKPTNKTATALVDIENAVTSLNDYKAFVENLYFLFREGVGQRLEGRIPSSFVEINDLRTMMQHDVDHGKPNKVAAKRKHLSTVFNRFSGVPSPDAVDPSTFPIVQANILGALEADLTALAKTLI
ncbi:DUF262 domain-containing protein [Planctomicrobium piriforme]|nr:DUF262 domain-containing protein [Planctomicrobium piriforme]